MSGERVGEAELRRLEHLRTLVPADRVAAPPRLLLFSRNGFTAELRRAVGSRAGVELVDPHRPYEGGWPDRQLLVRPRPDAAWPGPRQLDAARPARVPPHRRSPLTGPAPIGLYGPERSIIDATRLCHREGPELAHTALKRWLRQPGSSRRTC